MLTRCYNENFEKYHLYGGRGIIVCSEWHTFENFYEDMGDRPDGMSLDRIDTNGNYCKENCRWASINDQNRNRRNVKWFTIEGETKTAQEWATIAGILPGSITRRKLRGWSDYECVFGKVTAL